MDFMNQFNDTQAQASFDAQDVDKNKAICIVGYLGILFFLPYIVDKNSNYCKFHANQAFAFFIACAIIGIVSGILSIIPILGALISIVVSLASFAAMIVLMICASQGMAVRIPIIGDKLEIFK